MRATYAQRGALSSGGGGLTARRAFATPQRMSTPLPQARVEVRRLGREGQPLVVIDDFSGQLAELRTAGAAARYAPAGAYYPGLRAPVDPAYLDVRRDLLVEVMHRVFGLQRSLRCETSAFSLVTLAPDALSPDQRVPHHDHGGPGLIALMHYLCGPESGGTAFYRHRRTGFEAITPERMPAFTSALEEDAREYGPPPSRYCHGDSEAYEMLDEVEARPDRLILYRGQTLHSGVIPDPAMLSDDPRRGRLTINMFFQGS